MVIFSSRRDGDKRIEDEHATSSGDQLWFLRKKMIFPKDSAEKNPLKISSRIFDFLLFFLYIREVIKI